MQTRVEAERALEALKAREAELIVSRDATAGKLAAAEKALGAAMLDGGADSVMEQVARLRLESDGLARAVVVIGERIAAAERAVRNAEAATLREQAAAKRRELDALERDTAPLLARLSELQGVPYTSWIMYCQPAPKAEFMALPSGAIHAFGTHRANGLDLTPETASPIGPFAQLREKPRAAFLAEEIAALEKQADEIEAGAAAVSA